MIKYKPLTLVTEQHKYISWLLTSLLFKSASLWCDSTILTIISNTCKCHGLYYDNNFWYGIEVADKFNRRKLIKINRGVEWKIK
mgnify:CR=1 FL=1